jgi:hypothetical protein
MPAIQAKAEGYNVYAVIDASGDPSPMASAVTIARMAQAGVVPISTNGVFCEFQRTWAARRCAVRGALLAVRAELQGGRGELRQGAGSRASAEEVIPPQRTTSMNMKRRIIGVVVAATLVVAAALDCRAAAASADLTS